MKGFYITISNGLLTGGHRGKMGSAVWEFMWLLDKITSINEDGIGKVLGGRPIKTDEIVSDIGITRKHVGIHLDILEKEGYINIIRAPYGLVISINKAQKVFGQKADETKTTHLRYDQNDSSLPKNDSSLPKNDSSLPKNDSSNKTRQLDKTITIQEEFDEDIKKILTYWNETYKKSYKAYIPLRNNFRYWSQTYVVEDVFKAIKNIKLDEFWRDKMTPEMLFRTRNPKGEEVDYIGRFINLAQEDESTLNDPPPEHYEYLKKMEFLRGVKQQNG